MNKKMKELAGLIEAKLAEAKAVADTDLEKANALMEEIKDLKQRYEVEKGIFEAEKDMVASAAGADAPASKKVEPEATTAKASTDVLMAKMIKTVFKRAAGRAVIEDKDLSDSVDADGGYTIPVDAITTINKYKEAYANLASEITVETVGTKTGSRVFQKRGTPGAFSKLVSTGMGYTGTGGTGPEANKVSSPKFEELGYSIEDYAGFMPVPNNLINDSDANILSVVYEWLGKAAADTDNAEILDLLGQSGTSGMGTGWTDLKDLDGIKRAANVTLGQAFVPTAKIYTNDDGAQYLAELKEKTGSNKPLLNPTITDPAQKQLSIGFNTLPVVILPNSVMKSIAATSSAGGKIPMIIGDFHEAFVKFDRQQMAIDASNVASIGSTNAFAQNKTLFRAILRADYKVRDSEAIVKGYIGTPKTSA